MKKHLRMKVVWSRLMGRSHNKRMSEERGHEKHKRVVEGEDHN